MEQNYIIFATIELFVFCIILYLIIRANIYVNTLQCEVNELYFYLPATIRDIKYDLKKFNNYVLEKVEKKALSQQEIGFLVGKITSGLVFAKFSVNPFKKKLALFSTFLKFWQMRERLKATFVCLIKNGFRK